MDALTVLPQPHGGKVEVGAESAWRVHSSILSIKGHQGCLSKDGTTIQLSINQEKKAGATDLNAFPDKAGDWVSFHE